MVKQESTLYIYTDGGSRGNPGPGAVGFLIYDKNKKLLRWHKIKIGRCTNNQAEYTALIKALSYARVYKPKQIFVTLDSELVAKQVNGEYKIKNSELQRLYKMLKQKEKDFEKVNYKHTKRTNPFIQKADKLVNRALDGKY